MKTKTRAQTGSRQESGVLYETGHDKAILTILQAVKKGDFSVRLPTEWTGMAGKIADEINDLIELNAMLASNPVCTILFPAVRATTTSIPPVPLTVKVIVP